MAKLLVGRAWEDSLAFISRERRLIVPVMLAFVLLPTVVMRTLVPEVADVSAVLSGRVPPWAPLLSYILLFVQFVGASTVILLALQRKGSLGGLIVTAARRTVVIFLAFLLLGLIVTPVAIVLALVLGSDAAAQGVVTPGMARAVSFFVLCFLLLVLRLFLLIPAIVAEPIGPWAGLRRGWQLGRGNGAKLIGTFLLLLTAGMLVNYAVGITIGSAAQVAFGSASGPTLGGIILSLCVALVTVAVQIVQNSMLAMLYRQAAGEG